MKPEEKARQDIDNLLTKTGWVIQDIDQINLGAGLGVAVREYPNKIRFCGLCPICGQESHWCH